MSIQCPSRVNPALIKHQSSTTLMSIQYINMASIWSQSNAKPMSIKTNQLPIHCKYNAIQMSIPTIVCQSVSIRRRSDVNQMPVQCRSYPNSLPIRFQFSANPVPIWGQSKANHLAPIHCQSYSNFPFNANLLIQCQSITNPSINCQSNTNSESNTNQMPILCKSFNPWPICQSITNMSIQRRFCTNLPIHRQFITYLPMHHQSSNPMPIQD